MKLEIDLTDREEIAAAVPLLQLILDNTHAKTCGGHCHAGEAAEVSRTVTATIGNASLSQTVTGPNANALPAFPFPPREEPDPAAVFGGAAPLAPSTPPAAAPLTSAPPAPATTVSTTATHGPASSGAAVASVELDKRGLPWDERIHSSSKAKLANGNWKNARGKAPEYVAQIEAELQAHMASANQIPAAPSGLNVPSAAPGVPLAPAIPIAPPVATLAPAAPVAPSANADPTTFEQLMPRITAAVTAGILPPTAVGAVCAAHGIPSVVTLQQNPSLVPSVWATLRQQYPGLA